MIYQLTAIEHQTTPRGHRFKKNSKAWTGLLYSNSHTRPFLYPTEQYSHSTHKGHNVDASHFHHNPPSPHQSGHSVSYLASLTDHDSLQPDIHTLYIFLNKLYSMFMEWSTTVYGRDISQYYQVLYMVPYSYSNYYINIGDPTVHLTTL